MICVLGARDFEEVIDFKRVPKPVKLELDNLDSRAHPEGSPKRRAIIEQFTHSDKAKLISFEEALTRIQQEQYIRIYEPTVPIRVTDDQKKNIIMLRKDFRNAFEHFTPISWSIENQLFVQPMRDTISVATELSRSFNLSICEKEHRARLSRVLDELPRVLDMNERELQAAP
jgi:hypothetical protein